MTFQQQDGEPSSCADARFVELGHVPADLTLLRLASQGHSLAPRGRRV